ncbi:LysM peptidoglycan-binding domain-containing C40 family peptidase [Streptomyces sp. NPDC006872]|uniref:C40 family peptidase n=1 Tax=Streptomyces sp. NPDC006872 TaxID=3155720 RepID=UPI0033FE2915
MRTGSLAAAAARRLAALLVLSLLATLFSVTVAAQAHPVPQPAAVAAHVPGPTGEQVLLRRGDTLWSLALRHGTTVAALQQANHLGHSTLIYAGRHLTLPPGTGKNTQATAPKDTGHGSAAGAGQTAVDFARHQLGVPYQWGGTGRGGFDCSGLVQAAWRTAGVHLPRTTYAQIDAGLRIRRGDLRPGDLVFTHHRGHVQLYAGDGQVIESARPGTRVRFSALPAAADVDAYLRPGHPHQPAAHR